MPLFDVCVTADVTMSQVLSIYAPTREKAENEALARANQAEMTVDDGNFYENYVSWAEKSTPTRASLMIRSAWKHLKVDNLGNPCVWRNYYEDEDGQNWSEDWSSQCDSHGHQPFQSHWIGPHDPAETALWESLSEMS